MIVASPAFQISYRYSTSSLLAILHAGSLCFEVGTTRSSGWLSIPTHNETAILHADHSPTRYRGWY